MTGQSPRNVAVIGGGIAGLTAAIYAARAGASVTLFERAATAGGRARSEVSGEALLNLGPHALYQSGAGAAVLRELGITPRGAVPATGGGVALRGGRRYNLPVSARTIATTRLFGLRARIEYARFMAGLAGYDTGSVAHVTVGEWLATTFKERSVREMLAAFIRLTSYTNAPEIQSAGAALDQAKLALKESVLYLDGGWSSLVSGLRGAAESAGVTIITGARVTAVVPVEGGCEVRRADGPPVRFGASVLAVSPRDAAALVPANLALGRWRDGAVPVRAACLDVVVDRMPRPARPFALGIDQPVYFSNHAIAAGLVPKGAALLSVAKYLPPGGADDAAAAELEAVLDVAQPGWRALVRHQRFLPGLHVMEGQAQATGGGLAGRPGPEVPGAPELFVAGDWVGPEGLLADGSFASGRSAGRQAAARAMATRATMAASA